MLPLQNYERNYAPGNNTEFRIIKTKGRENKFCLTPVRGGRTKEERITEPTRGAYEPTNTKGES